MEFTISAQEFGKALSAVQSTVNRRATMPILAFVKIEAKDNEITITATDLEQTIVSRSPADVAKDGQVAVQSKTLFDVVRSLPSLPLNFTVTDNHQIMLKCGNGQYRLLGIGTEEFPVIESGAEGKYAKVEGSKLARMIQQTLYTISNDETKQHLRGALFEMGEKDTIIIVSTDGHRLSVAKDVVEGIAKTGLKETTVVPGKGLRELQKFLEAEEGKVELNFSNTHLRFRGSNISFFIRLQDTRFPDYKVVIPDQNDKKPLINRPIFQDVIKRISVLSSEMYNRVQLKFEGDKLEVSAINEDVGEAKEEIAISYSGEELTIGFNAKYLLEALAAIDSEDVVFSLMDDASAGLIQGEGDETFVCVIMPMRM